MLQWKMGCQTKTRRVWFPHERTGNHSCEKLQQIADAQNGMIRNQDMNSSNHLFVCSSFSRVHAQRTSKKPCWKGESSPFFLGKKNHQTSISLHPPLIRPSVQSGKVGETRASPTGWQSQDIPDQHQSTEIDSP